MIYLNYGCYFTFLNYEVSFSNIHDCKQRYEIWEQFIAEENGWTQ